MKYNKQEIEKARKKPFIKLLLDQGFVIEEIEVTREYGLDCLRKRFPDKSSILITSECGAALPESEKDFRITYYKAENLLDETLSEEDEGTEVSGSVFCCSGISYFEELNRY